MLDKKMDEYITRVEEGAYELGISVGRNQERERILGILIRNGAEEGFYDQETPENYLEVLNEIRGRSQEPNE